MSKTGLIISREYLSRVRKKSFLIMTILGPILMAAVFIVPVLIMNSRGDDTSYIQVVDETGLFQGKLTQSESIKFEFLDGKLDSLKDNYDEERTDGILYIPSVAINFPQGIFLYTAKQPSLTLISYIEKTLQKEMEAAKLEAAGVDEKLLVQIRTHVKIQAKVMTDKGEESASADLATAVGFISAMMIYVFIFLYGAQVMRGVIEEKTSRIVEVIISSVKPFQLMMGKIIGIALVGLTQFVLWIILTFALTTVAGSVLLKDKVVEKPQHIERGLGDIDVSAVPVTGDAKDVAIAKVFENLESINFPLVIGAFLFYFLGGYLLYSALFAAVGAAVDSETDTQQFMLPVTIPLILSIIVAQSIMTHPDGNLAFWFSVIPFTSPVVMMVRIPFGIPTSDLIISALSLIAGFIFTTWLASKIYRTGILMYGKKVSFREIGKWLFYKE